MSGEIEGDSVITLDVRGSIGFINEIKAVARVVLPCIIVSAK